MSKTQELLGLLEDKVTNLLVEFNELKVSVNEKTREIERLRDQLSSRDEALEQLTVENEKLKSSNSSKENEDIKLKIGEMVKEIDKCISLLKV